MKTSESKNSVTTKRGSVIEITATSTRHYEMIDEVSYCDGDNVTISRGKETKCDKLVIVISNDLTLSGHITRIAPIVNCPKSYGYFVSDNNKLMPIDEDVYNVMMGCVNAARVEAEKDTEWSAMRRRQIEAEEVNARYHDHVNNVDRMMTLNGRTY